MPIFGTFNTPKVPKFHLGPEIHELGPNPSETDEIGSQYSSSDGGARFPLERGSSTMHALTSKMTSMFQKRQRSTNTPGKDLFKSLKNSRSDSSFSLSSGSQSKFTSYRIAEQHRSLFFFTSRNPLRRLLIRVTESSFFDFIIMVCIVLNCISLAMTNPGNSDQLVYILSTVEWVFTGIFSLEMIMKIIALGFILHPASYMRNPWNVLDFVIVSLAFFQVIPSINNYSALRSLRALRPLRSIRGVPGLRIIVNSLLQSIPPFINVLVLLFFSFGIFGILGVQLFRGVLRNRCVITGSSFVDSSGDTMWDLAYDDKGQEILCSLFWLGRECPASYMGQSVHCQAYGSPSSPLSGTINFDHIGWAFMQVFQIYAGEEWTLMMYQVQDAWSHLGVIYFLIVMFFGALFAVNLGLAVINDKFNQVSKQSDSDTASVSMKTRIYTALQSRKESAWLMSKLTWLDYHSDSEEECDAIPSENWASTDRSGTNSQNDDDSVSTPHSANRQSKLHLHINTSRISSTMSHRSPKSSSSSDDRTEDPFAIPPIEMAQTVTTIADSSDDGDEQRAPSTPIQTKTQTNTKKGTHKRKTMKKRSTNRLSVRRLSSMRQRPKGCCAGCLYFTYRLSHKIRRVVHHTVRNEWFTRFMLVTIVLNTLFLAVEHYNQPDWLTMVEEISNYIFTSIFTVELTLKLYGLGISFFKDWFNILDFFVVGASIVELVFADMASFSALRTFRLLRVFKLLTWKSLRKLTETILKSFRSIFYLCIIFSLFVFVMTLISMQSFAGRLDALGPPVQNFDDFIHAAITVFQIITKENWVYVYADLMGAQSGDALQDFTTIAFMVTTIILGDFILLNLFLAILLQSFDDDVEELIAAKRSKSMAILQSRNQSLPRIESTTLVQPYSQDALTDDSDIPGAQAMMKRRDSSPVHLLTLPQSPPDPQRLHRRFSDFIISRWRQWRALKHVSTRQIDRHLSMESMDRGNGSSQTPLDELAEQSAHDPLLASSPMLLDEEVEGVKKNPMPLKGRSLFIFPPGFPLRVILRRILIHSVTEFFLLFCVTVSSVMLAVETPDLDPQSVLGKTVFWMGVFFASVFTVEMFLKLFTQGIVILSFNKENRVGYLNDPWNILDAIIVVVTILSLVYTDSRVSAIKALRALRPLRFVNKVHGLRVVIGTLFRSISAILNVLIICLLVYLIFSILGVQLFSGKFYYCTTEHIQSEQDCLFPEGMNRTLDLEWDTRSNTCNMRPEFEETLIYRDNCTVPMLWKNNQWHFDHLPSALLVLFEVGSIENWPDISNVAVSAVGVDMQPKQDHNIFAALYFVFFVAIGAMFIVNLFVGVVLSNFNRIKEEEDGSLMLSEQQKDWVATQRLFMKLKLVKRLVPPKIFLRKLVFYLVTNTKFEYFITFLIVVNIVFMAIEHDGMTNTLSSVLSIANLVFTGIFVLEAVFKMIGLGLFQYFTDMWNLFDFLVVWLSIFGILANYFVTGIAVNPTILRVFRIFRIFRILRLVKRAKRIRALLETLYYSIPSMMNVMLTVTLACFIYSIIGMNLFYYVKPNNEMTHLANFKGFFNSFLVMIRISTSEDWNGIMRDCMNTENCIDDECGNPWLAVPFFVSYIIIVTFVVMNLFVAVILDNFETQMRFEDSALNSTDLSRFVDIWSELDPKATYTIQTKLLKNLLVRVGLPLGLPVECSRADVIRKLVTLDIPEHQGKIHFIETLIPLARRVYNVDLPVHERRKLEKNLARRFKSLNKMNSTFGYTTGEYFAATYIQAAFRGRQVRKNGSAAIGLELVRTDSGRLRFKIDRRCHRVVKEKEWVRRVLEKHDEAEKEVETASHDATEVDDMTISTDDDVYSSSTYDDEDSTPSPIETPVASVDTPVSDVQESVSVDDDDDPLVKEQEKKDDEISGLSSMRFTLAARSIELRHAEGEDGPQSESSSDLGLQSGERLLSVDDLQSAEDTDQRLNDALEEMTFGALQPADEEAQVSQSDDDTDFGGHLSDSSNR
eukprot:CAMPEP_0117439440 /NCGR_PEP_ID=MMETSP0759-20121206/2566_1 /TAXON_ID=63605 /ORGANISM="Percolomonas cosmopolitus, Strain WS" /LENGTH=1994 /DNA_ID=CAMNT_0005231155 /DNA_START=388 /DNA_END=6369 /DNA_ORIENTATION=-